MQQGRPPWAPPSWASDLRPMRQHASVCGKGSRTRLAAHAWRHALLGGSGPSQELRVGPVPGVTRRGAGSRPCWVAEVGLSTLTSPRATLGWGWAGVPAGAPWAPESAPCPRCGTVRPRRDWRCLRARWPLPGRPPPWASASVRVKNGAERGLTIHGALWAGGQARPRPPTALPFPTISALLRGPPPCPVPSQGTAGEEGPR